MGGEPLRIAEDEFTGTTLDLLERSFGVMLPRGAGYVYTVGGLFDEILYQRAGRAGGKGERCDTAMLFFRLRPTLARLNPDVPVTPSSPMADLARMRSKRLAKRLVRETGLAMPDPLPGKLGCASWISGFILAPLAWWLIDVRAFAFVAVASFVMMLFDRGGYWAEWKTVWSLVDAVARKNVARLDAMGAGDREEDLWRRYAEILALSAAPLPNGARMVEARRIHRNMMIELV